jgi:hypothetical protein
MRIKRVAIYLAVTFALLFVGIRQVRADATISVGTYTPSTTMPFVVPIEITGAVNLINWQFDLKFDPARSPG